MITKENTYNKEAWEILTTSCIVLSDYMRIVKREKRMHGILPCVFPVYQDIYSLTFLSGICQLSVSKIAATP